MMMRVQRTQRSTWMSEDNESPEDGEVKEVGVKSKGQDQDQGGDLGGTGRAASGRFQTSPD